MRTGSVVLFIASLVPSPVRPQEAPAATEVIQSIAPLHTALATPADTSRPPADFVPVDTEPVVLEKKEPTYPALALKAGIEGKVWVRVWIDENGSAHEVQVQKSDNDIFNQAAMDAAREFRFKPALLNGKPVAVWVAIPFKFKIGGTTASPDYGVDSLLAFIQDVAIGKTIDERRIQVYLHPGAKVVIGGKLHPLADALHSQGKSRAALGVPGNKILAVRSVESVDSSAMMIMVEAKGSNARMHLQMISVERDAHGHMRIRQCIVISSLMKKRACGEFGRDLAMEATASGVATSDVPAVRPRVATGPRGVLDSRDWMLFKNVVKPAA